MTTPKLEQIEILRRPVGDKRSPQNAWWQFLDGDDASGLFERTRVS